MVDNLLDAAWGAVLSWESSPLTSLVWTELYENNNLNDNWVTAVRPFVKPPVSVVNTQPKFYRIRSFKIKKV